MILVFSDEDLQWPVGGEQLGQLILDVTGIICIVQEESDPGLGDIGTRSLAVDEVESDGVHSDGRRPILNL